MRDKWRGSYTLPRLQCDCYMPKAVFEHLRQEYLTGIDDIPRAQPGTYVNYLQVVFVFFFYHSKVDSTNQHG